MSPSETAAPLAADRLDRLDQALERRSRPPTARRAPPVEAPVEKGPRPLEQALGPDLEARGGPRSILWIVVQSLGKPLDAR